MHYWKKFIGLPLSTKRTLLRVALLLPVVRFALLVLPFRVIAQFAERTSNRRRSAPSDAAYERDLTWAASGLGKIMLGDRPCLTQALLVQWLLARRGMAASLRLGVNKASGGKLVAHAWLEREGRNIIGGRKAHHHYAQLAPLQHADAAVPSAQ